MKKQEYVPYKYKTTGKVFIDAVTGLASTFDPKVKGDGDRARLK